MYGLVMLTALSSGADVSPVPQSAPMMMSCTGCCGVVLSSCTGCYGSGHGMRQRHGLFGHHRASCQGCSGNSCSGWSCFGSCFGCGGCTGISDYRSSCFGYGNFGGSCYGFGTLQGTPFQAHGGGFGGGIGLPVTLPPYSVAGYGWGYGPAFIYGNPYAVYGVVNQPPTMVDPKPGDPKPMDKPKDPTKPKDGMGANLKFRVPAAAKLYVDGRLTMLSGTERAFTTPPLLEGQKFYYDVTAEIVIDGRSVIEQKRVLVEAGSDVTSSFTALIAAAEVKAIPVAGK